MPDLIRRLWIKLGLGLVALVAVVVGLGALDSIKGIKDWLGFVGSFVLMIPVLHLELAKLEIKSLRSLIAQDPRVQTRSEEGAEDVGDRPRSPSRLARLVRLLWTRSDCTSVSCRAPIQ